MYVVLLYMITGRTNLLCPGIANRIRTGRRGYVLTKFESSPGVDNR